MSEKALHVIWVPQNINEILILRLLCHLLEVLIYLLTVSWDNAGPAYQCHTKEFINFLLFLQGSDVFRTFRKQLHRLPHGLGTGIRSLPKVGQVSALSISLCFSSLTMQLFEEAHKKAVKNHHFIWMSQDLSQILKSKTQLFRLAQIYGHNHFF